MNYGFVIAIVVLLGYLLGAIPAGYIAGRIAGVDIRKEGSGNVGATNVVRVLGKKYGYPVFFIDVLKGVIAVVSASYLANRFGQSAHVVLLAILAGVACVIGHNFPVWLGFRGGKGVATSVGVVFALMPIAAIAVLVVWVLTFQLGRWVSLASVIAALALPIAVALCYLRGPGGMTLLSFSAVLTLLVLLRHRSNLVRLVQGTEPRFRRR